MPSSFRIIKSAREGDGFSEYWTNKPLSGGMPQAPPSIWLLDKYQWVVGTGFYIDDIDNELATLRSERERPCMAPETGCCSSW